MDLIADLRSAGFTSPLESTGSIEDSILNDAKLSITFNIAGCSIADVITCFFSPKIRDQSTMLFDSVPLPVKKISSFSAPIASAIILLVDSIIDLDFLPEE